jgi:hypothetical protein
LLRPQTPENDIGTDTPIGRTIRLMMALLVAILRCLKV